MASPLSVLIGAKDWSRTSLGPAESWPLSLTQIVKVMLASGFPMAVRWGPDFVMIYNDGYRPILGDKHPWALGRPFRDVWPEVQPQLGPLHDAILSGERGAFFAQDLLLRIRRYGEAWEDARFTISYSPVPDISAPTGVGAVLITAVETTQRVRTEQALRASEERYRTAMMLGRMGSWEVDFVQRTRTWTSEAMTIFGIDVAGGIGHVGGDHGGGEADEFREAMHPDDRHLLAQYHALANSQDSFPAEYRIVKSGGEIRWLSGYGRVLDRQPDGNAHRLINVVTDITERKAAEDHQRFLLQELTHRSKNLLGIVQALADRTARNSGDLTEFQRKFEGRLRGLAASNSLLARGDWRGTSLKAILEGQLASFVELPSPRIEVHGPYVDLSAGAAQAIGLALHELATNAIKYGALSGPDGCVSIRWEIDRNAGGLRLEWRERDGPRVSFPERTGFGHAVMKTMVEQAVQGTVELEFAATGLRWSLHAPASALLSGSGHSEWGH